MMHSRCLLNFFAATVIFFSMLALSAQDLPPEMVKIMTQPKYKHSSWAIYAKDLTSGQVLYNQRANEMFLPASTTKMFSMAALLNAYGNEYRFKTPVYAIGTIENGKLTGDLVIVGQGDLTLGGRQQDNSDIIEFTPIDHIYANIVPGATLTEGHPLHGLKEIAKQIKQAGINEMKGMILVDDRLFESSEHRGTNITPLMINENLIDIVLNPGEIDQPANLGWRPNVVRYSVRNNVKTVAKGGPMDIKVTTDRSGRNIMVEGTLPIDQKNIVRTAPIINPKDFARAAILQALRDEGIQVKLIEKNTAKLPDPRKLEEMKPIAVWTSPPLSEYAKLVLKVSHNTGANLVPLLLAVKNKQKTYDEGMLLLGKFVSDVLKISPDAFVFGDAAGGDSNRVTLLSEAQLLEYMSKLPKKQFDDFFNALPVLGVDGSLADFAKNTKAVGKVNAKTGTGVSQNLASGEYFLTTQSLSGYIMGANGHLIAFMLAVDNAKMPTIDNVFAFFEDQGQLAAFMYNQLAK